MKAVPLVPSETTAAPAATAEAQAAGHVVTGARRDGDTAWCVADHLARSGNPRQLQIMTEGKL